jgi:hypothetical protein
LPVVDVCAAAAFWTESVAAAFASADVALVVDPVSADVVACGFPCPVIGATWAVAANAVVKLEESAAVLLPACTPALRVTVAVARAAFVVGCVGVGALAVVVSELVLSGADGPVCGAITCALAAIAAAAMASGAVGPPDAGGVDGVFVSGVDVGTATATGCGVVGVLPTCSARRVASTVVAAASVSSPCALSSPDFDVADVVFVVAVVFDWPAALAEAPLLPTLAEPPASEPLSDGLLLEALSDASVAGEGPGGLLPLACAALLPELLAGGLLSGVGAASALFCGGGGGGGDGALESFGVFWLTRFPKRSFADDGAARVSHDGVAWNAALADTSWVTLGTGQSPTRELDKDSQQGPGQPACSINIYIFQWLVILSELAVSRFEPVFSARRQDLPYPTIRPQP